MTDLSGTQVSTGGGAINQVVAMFETYEQARAARDSLVAAGVDRSRIELLDQAATDDDATFRYDRNEQGFWGAIKSLFMPDDESHVYAEGLGRGHAMLVVRGAAGEPAGGQDRIISLLESQNPLDVETHAAQWRQSGWSGSYAGRTAGDTYTTQTATQARAAGTASTSAAALGTTTGTVAGLGTGREEVIPVYEEQLRVGKREVGRGSVRVRSYVVETPVQEQVRLHEERVEVERRPVDRPATGADLGAEAFRERTIEVTATAEEAVIAKDTRVKEEIVVRKQEEERTQTVSDTVRHTEVEVEDDRAAATNAPVPGTTTTRRP
ncbi:MAG: DUF2382 domain-containing protein [Alphaproteobacteria bacterium]|nr:DUF2382 domain-containing protein [Alphaproteobacteria bacterium]MBV9862233.1 DUF2382 domain-containing protein [Alphaproteobacteria bacterium]